NREARSLQADALEQMGYQAESATWRNAYLMGAKELREGSPDWGRIPTRDMSNAMTAEHLIDTVGVRFDPGAFDREPGRINLHLTELDEDHVLGVGRSAIHHAPDQRDPDAVASIRVTRAQLFAALDDPAALDDVPVDGDRTFVIALFTSLARFSTAALIEP
ncbi:MAG: alkyl sulfatase C-terminal domain-containing protein, partial [Actinomycetota bacterium]